MKVRLLDKNRRPVYLPDVSEVVIMDDEQNPISVAIQQSDMVTCAHAAEQGFDNIARKCGLNPSRVKVIA